jgi:hypothetical protein
VLADAGYWHTNQMEPSIAGGTQVLIPPDSGLRAGARPGWEGGYYAFMRRVLATDHGRGSTASEKTASMRCSARSKPTDDSTASYEEAAARSGLNGG